MKTKIMILCGAIAATALLMTVYLALSPGEYIEPGELPRLILIAILYAGILSLSLIIKRGRLYFAFPLVLAAAELLNFSPVERYYAVQQQTFAIRLTLWCWGLDLLWHGLWPERFRIWRSVLPTLLEILLFGLPLYIIGHHLFLHTKFTYDSIQAIYQTDFAEAIDYLVATPACLTLILCGLAGIGLSAWLNARTDPGHQKWQLTLFASLIFIFMTPSVFLDFTEVNSLNRTKVLITDSLNYFKTIEHYAAGEAIRRKTVLQNVTDGSGDDGIYVLILGESHSRTRSSAYGYQLQTTPFMAKAANRREFILMRQAYSCHVQTVPVLEQLLTSRNQYCKDGKPQVSLFDVSNFLGYDTVFLSNQYPHGRFDTPVAALISNAKEAIWLNTMEDFILWRARYDSEVAHRLPPLLSGQKKLIILHLMGSHGPYYRRYPEEFARDLPWIPYDKSILYSDTVLENIFTQLRKNPSVRAAVYVSDHAEIPGVGHAADLFQPEMTQIPMLLYLSESLRRERPELERTLRKHAEKTFTNDLIFELMLGLMNIRHTFAAPGTDPTASDYRLNENNARTLSGRRKLDGTEVILTPKP